jgi:hypothetical protein
MGIDKKTYGPAESRIYALRRQHDRARFTRVEAFYRLAREQLDKLRQTYTQSPDVCIADISDTALRDVREDVYVDDGHLRQAGNVVVAKAIVAQLNRCELLPWKNQQVRNGVPIEP